MRLLPLLIVVVLALPAAAAAETLYKWTDAEGITHYSDSPPPEDSDFEAREIRVDPAPPPIAEAPEAAATASTDAQATPTASENCTRVRANVETLERSEVVRMDLDGDGTSEALTDAQREQQLEIAQRQVEVYCTPGAPADADGEPAADSGSEPGSESGDRDADGSDADAALDGGG